MQATELMISALRRQRRSDQSWEEVTWVNREYFFGALYCAMRRALIDHARARKATKRQNEIALAPEDFASVLDRHDIENATDETPEIIEALMQALSELGEAQSNWATMIEYRFFGGLTLEETASIMEVSVPTIQRWWRRARLVLHKRVNERLNV